MRLTPGKDVITLKISEQWIVNRLSETRFFLPLISSSSCSLSMKKEYKFSYLLELLYSRFI